MHILQTCQSHFSFFFKQYVLKSHTLITWDFGETNECTYRQCTIHVDYPYPAYSVVAAANPEFSSRHRRHLGTHQTQLQMHYLLGGSPSLHHLLQVPHPQNFE